MSNEGIYLKSEASKENQKVYILKTEYQLTYV
jgi:hypothetical protein